MLFFPLKVVVHTLTPSHHTADALTRAGMFARLVLLTAHQGRSPRVLAASPLTTLESSMLSHVARLALLVASLLLTTTACSGEPEIPDQAPTSKQYQYRSTESAGETTAGNTTTA
ncbi:MAG: hypothetical protein KC492_42785, partial [Myxococcales bacterium]|nr:hypothetical protein [Myxococcales bacterium]